MTNILKQPGQRFSEIMISSIDKLNLPDDEKSILNLVVLKCQADFLKEELEAMKSEHKQFIKKKIYA